MKVTVKKLAPSVKNHVNRGGSFKEYRHKFTNYDFVIKGLSDVDYKALVVVFGGEMLAASSDAKWVADVKEWMSSKL